MKALAFIICLSVCLIPPAFADCYSDARGYGDMMQCSEQELAELEKKQQTMLRQIEGRLDSKKKQIFLNAHTAWRRYRNSNCEVEAAYFIHGLNSNLFKQGCLIGMMESYNQQLESLDLLLSPASPESMHKAFTSLLEQMKSASLPPEDKQRELQLIRDSQTDWQTYQSRVCQLESALGTENNHDCSLRLSKERTRQLNLQLDFRGYLKESAQKAPMPAK